MSVTKIAIGVDGSEGTARAVRWTAELARRLEVGVVAVHAFEPLDHLDDIEPGVDFADVRRKIRDENMPSWIAPLTNAGVDTDVVVEDGAAADELLQAAAEHGADLIVVGARRMGVVRRIALGSTSQKVLHDASVPVVVIHPE